MHQVLHMYVRSIILLSKICLYDSCWLTLMCPRHWSREEVAVSLSSSLPARHSRLFSTLALLLYTIYTTNMNRYTITYVLMTTQIITHMDLFRIVLHMHACTCTLYMNGIRRLDISLLSIPSFSKLHTESWEWTRLTRHSSHVYVYTVYTLQDPSQTFLRMPQLPQTFADSAVLPVCSLAVLGPAA